MASARGRLAVWVGAALLAVTALVHLGGYATIPDSDTASGQGRLYAILLRPLWLFAGLHWLLIALLCLLVADAGPHVRRAMLGCCALFVFADAILLYAFVGPFIGVALLAAAATAFGVAAFWTAPRPSVGLEL